MGILKRFEGRLEFPCHSNLVLVKFFCVKRGGDTAEILNLTMIVSGENEIATGISTIVGLWRVTNSLHLFRVRFDTVIRDYVSNNLQRICTKGALLHAELHPKILK